jgi:hypothetical protein
MKNTVKAFAIVLAPTFVMMMIFNATVLKAYANDKRMEIKNNRSPAVLKKG